MKYLYIKEIIKAVDGILISENKDIENVFISNISTDTRNISNGQLFIPIKGDNFDGHEFINSAFEKGALCVLTEKDISTDKLAIKVKDTRKALGDLAMYYRSLFDIPVVAITGSAGKTTTKDMIFSVLKEKYNVLKTEGNFNNDIGLPLTVFKLDDSYDVAVFEMGMSHFNEIHYLSKIAKPDIAVITNIGVSHIENLGSRDGILKAKCEIFDYLSQDGIKILNGNDDKLIKLKENQKKTCFYGYNSTQNDVFADEIAVKGISGISCQIHTPKSFFYVDIPQPGMHMVSNALAAASVGYYLNLTNYEIKNGIENFKPTKMRMDIIKTDKYTIINDVYNANPNSVKAGIDVISSALGRKVCVLGDMLELGKFAKSLHREIGEYAAEKGIDVIICIGEISKNMYEGAFNIINKYQQVFYFKNQDEFLENVFNIIKSEDTILVKASRGMKFEKTIEKITR